MVKFRKPPQKNVNFRAILLMLVGECSLQSTCQFAMDYI